MLIFVTSTVVFKSAGEGNRSLTASGIRQVIDQQAYLAKLPDLHPHALRHTFALYLIKTDEGLEMKIAPRTHEWK